MSQTPENLVSIVKKRHEAEIKEIENIFDKFLNGLSAISSGNLNKSETVNVAINLGENFEIIKKRFIEDWCNVEFLEDISLHQDEFLKKAGYNTEEIIDDFHSKY
jgi:uncharacterized protein YgfB (UPF0149 family)